MVGNYINLGPMTIQATEREATPEEINRFIKVVDDFKAKYARLISPEFRAQVYATGDTNVINEYTNTVSKARALNTTIDKTVGAWNTAKNAYRAVTDVTSTAIGDAIDWVRGLFGDNNMSAYDVSPISGGQLGQYDVSPISGGQLGFLGSLGALPAVALGAIWVTSIISGALLINEAMEKVFVYVSAHQIKKDDPSMPMSEAYRRAAETEARGGMFADITTAIPLIAAAAILAYLAFGKKK